jgi:methylenetetrahydrofolate dehydrogenase (NADP+) / methenyltetrahydrofolate cyclohydrolase
MELLNGKETSLKIQEDLKNQVEELVSNGERVPHLAALLVGEDGASKTYVGAKVKACERIGYDSTEIILAAETTQDQLLSKIHELNVNDRIDGFIVQLPLPEHINVEAITDAILPSKDVDGFHMVNVGKLLKGQPCFISATPLGIMELLRHYKVETEGKHCVVVGRSDIVGTPLSVLMSRKAYPGNSTVTLCHSKTRNLKEITLQGDILVGAVGAPNYIREDMVKEGATVIDVGITRVKDETKKSGFRLVGDIDFEKVSEKASYITPVPGGVGPMTIAALLINTMHAYMGDFY